MCLQNISRLTPDFDSCWYDKAGYVWLTISLNPFYVDTVIWVESEVHLYHDFLDDIAGDVPEVSHNEHSLEDADPLELQKIK